MTWCAGFVNRASQALPRARSCERAGDVRALTDRDVRTGRDTKALRRRRFETLTRGILWESPRDGFTAFSKRLLRSDWDLSYDAPI